MSKNGKGGAVLPPTILSVFAYGSLLPETADCVIRQQRRWPELDVEVRYEDALIPRMRDRVASWFVEHTDREVLIMLDHDVMWEEGDLEYIAQKCSETKGVVAGIYPKRGLGQDPPMAPSPDAPDGRYHFGEDVLIPALHLPTGFMAIHRDVLVALAERLPYTMSGCWPFFLIGLFPGMMPEEHQKCTFCMPAEDGGFAHFEYLSEDWAFSRRVAEIGKPLLAALKPRLKHIGHYVYRMVDAITQPEPDRPIPVTIDRNIHTPIEVLYSLTHDMAEFFNGIPLDRIALVVRQARQRLSEMWLEAKIETPEQEMAFYKRKDVGRYYIPDLMEWHQRGVIALMIHEVEEFMPELDGPVLDYGAGIGSLMLHLAKKGAAVTAYEPNEELRRFIRFRAERMGADLEVRGTVPDGRYKLIVCWHVLEHVPDPGAVVRDLERMLLPGGRILSQSDFHVDPIHAMHHEREDNGDGLFAEAGLVRVGPNTWARASEVAEWQTASASRA